MPEFEEGRKEIIEKNADILKQNALNRGDISFAGFIGKLNTEEKAAYFYIEAQRSNEMIKSLSSMSGSELDIESLKNPDNKKYLPLGMNSDSAIKSLIEFWDLFGKTEKPGSEIRGLIIEKHELHYKAMSNDEKDFFLNC